jgi:hypothetical protein
MKTERRGGTREERDGTNGVEGGGGVFVAGTRIVRYWKRGDQSLACFAASRNPCQKRCGKRCKLCAAPWKLAKASARYSTLRSTTGNPAVDSQCTPLLFSTS